jgi:hypothetical protein
MFYTIYKITNTVNGKYYIGKHQTLDLDDGYMGSGMLIGRAIKKHGLESFAKEILFVFDTEEEMNVKEAEIVIVSKETYNLCKGGKGGWGYVNSNPDKFLTEKKMLNLRLQGTKNIKHLIEYINDPLREKQRKKNSLLALQKAREKLPFHGRYHSEETKQKIGYKNSINQSGKNNSQYGSMWITNGKDSRKIMKNKTIPEGWQQGRII